jgi:hypothetical protein
MFVMNACSISGKSLHTSSCPSVAPLPKAASLVALLHPSLSCANCLHLTIPTLFKSLQWELDTGKNIHQSSCKMPSIIDQSQPKLQYVAPVCGVPDMNFLGKCLQYELRYRTGHNTVLHVKCS